MATYAELYDIVLDPSHVLQKQLHIGLMKAATDVLNEDPQTANHTKRKEWAEFVKTPAGRQTMVDKMVWDAMGNATIGASPAAQDDGTIQWLVNGLIDTYAGT